MVDREFDRRDFIKTSGATITLATFAGCTGGGDDDDESTATPIGGDDTVDLGDFAVPSENVVPGDELSADQEIDELSLIVEPPRTTPQDHSTCMEVAEEASRLGVDMSVETMTWPTQVENVWYGDDWDMTFWEMVGRPSRLDPDEFLMQMFHTDFHDGYNYYNWVDDDYDQLVVDQRQEQDLDAREQLIHECQQKIADRGPSTFIMYPEIPIAWNADKWDGVVEMQGMGSRNMLTFVNIEPTTDDETLVISNDSEIEYINPFQQSGEGDMIQNRMIWDRLVWPDENAMPSPRMAESFDWVDDTTLQVDIREGMRFHDGQEVLAEDVKFSYDVHNEYDTYYTGSVSPINEIEVTDDYRLQMHLDYHFAPFPLTAMGRIGIVPKAHWEDIIDNEMEVENPMEHQEDEPVGSGPLQHDFWDQGNEAKQVRFDDHFDPVAYQERVTRLIPETQTTLTQLENGTIDMLGMYRGDNSVLADRVEANDHLTMTSTTSVGFKQISYNNHTPPFHIDAFRRAMHHRVPKDLIVEEIYDGWGTKAPNTPVSSALDTWHDGDLDEYPFDIQQAANELVEAGFVWDEEDGRLHMPADRTEP